MRAAIAGYVGSALLVTFGVAWFSFGAGLIVAGVCGAALTTLLLVDVPGGGDE